MVYSCNYDKCIYTFTTWFGQELHEELYHEDDFEWVCEIKDCAYCFSSEKKIDQHIKFYHEKKLLNECCYKDCPYSFSTQQKLREHIKYAHKLKYKIQCNYIDCPYMAPKGKPSTLKAHEDGNQHKGLKYCKCKFCDKLFQDISKLNTHEKSNCDKNPNRIFLECKFCIEPDGSYLKFSRLDTLKRHNKRKHNNEIYDPRFYCAKCNYNGSDKYDFKNHYNTPKHNDPDANKCLICEISINKITILDTYRELLEHKEIVHKNLYYCNKCNYKTKRTGHIKRHYHCELCNMGINSDKGFNPHCFRCFCNLNPNDPRARPFKRKETEFQKELEKYFDSSEIKKILEEKKTDIDFDKKIQGGCSLRRPDCLIEFDSYSIILELDEDQHFGYSCENKRMMELFQDLGNRPLIILRLNPDSYELKGKKIGSCFQKNQDGLRVVRKEWNLRINDFYRYLTYYIKNEPKKDLVVKQLYYDEYEMNDIIIEDNSIVDNDIIDVDNGVGC